MEQPAWKRDLRRGRRAPISALFLLGWAAVGVLMIGGVLAVFTIGPILLLAGGLLAVPLISVKSARSWAGGLLLGPGLLMLVDAWYYRDGPGTRCTATYADVGGRPTVVGSACGEIPGPWPHLLLGFVLIGGAIAAIAFLVVVRRPAQSTSADRVTRIVTR